MALIKTKLEGYANKVYRGDLKRFKERQKKDTSFSFELFVTQSKVTKGKRIPLSSPQGKVVIERYKECAICSKKHNDPDDFQIHHVNGDRSYTVTSNLVLLCHSCHKKVHTHAMAKLKDYKVKNKRTSSKTQSPFERLSFTQPTFNSPPFSLPFSDVPKKKGRKK